MTKSVLKNELAIRNLKICGMGRYRLLIHTLFCSFLCLLLCASGCKPKDELSAVDPKPVSISNEVKTLAEEIAADNYIGTEQIARKQEMDSAYSRRLKLMRVATDSELLALTGNPNAVVNLIAFEGLYNRENSTVPTIFEGFKNRSDMIRYIRGDLALDMPMLEYAYVYILRYSIPDEESPSEIEPSLPKFELSREEQSAIIEKIDGLRADGK